MGYFTSIHPGGVIYIYSIIKHRTMFLILFIIKLNGENHNVVCPFPSTVAGHGHHHTIWGQRYLINNLIIKGCKQQYFTFPTKLLFNNNFYFYSLNVPVREPEYNFYRWAVQFKDKFFNLSMNIPGGKPNIILYR